MTEVVKMVPKSEWHTLSLDQLYDVKIQMTSKYYNMKDINASFASQYMKFIADIDGFIKRKEAERSDESD